MPTGTIYLTEKSMVIGYLKTESGVVKQTVPQESAKGKIKGASCHTDAVDDTARVYEGGARLLTSRCGGDTERSRKSENPRWTEGLVCNGLECLV